MNITKDDLEAIEIVEPYFPHRRLLKRALFLKMKKVGIKNKVIASVLDVRPETLSSWGKTFDLSGVVKLFEWNYQGRKSSLHRDNVQQIIQRHNKEPFLDGYQLQEYIVENFDIDFCLQWVHKIAKQKLGINFIEERKKEELLREIKEAEWLC